MADADWIVEGGKAIVTTGAYDARRVTITKVTRTRVTTSDTMVWVRSDLRLMTGGAFSTSHLCPPDDPGALRRLARRAVRRLVDRGVQVLKEADKDVDPADLWRRILADVQATGERMGWTDPDVVDGRPGRALPGETIAEQRDREYWEGPIRD